MRYLSVCSDIEAASVKRCAVCGTVKSLEEFHKQPGGKYGRHSYCKPCYFSKSYRKKVPSPEVRRDRNYRSRYGISASEFDAALSRQNGRCAICERIPARPVLDHNHLTGAVRGILCHNCNISLPYIESERFRNRALAYLSDHLLERPERAS